VHINDLLPAIRSHSLPLFFADDTSVIYLPESDYFQNSISDVCNGLNKWFKANKLSLNFGKTNFITFATNNKTCIHLNIGYDKTNEEVLTTEFHGLQIDNNLKWKKYTECFVLKLSSSLHSVSTRNKNHLHRSIANLSCFQKCVYYAGIRILNSLPYSLTSQCI
jgi:hypothetical protein